MTEYTSGPSSYTDNSPFVRTLRNESHVRIIDAMLTNPEKKHTVSRLMELTGMARSTVLRALETLEQMGLIKQPGSVGGINRYQPANHTGMKHLQAAQMALLTDEKIRDEAPTPENHDDQESILGESFGDTPDLDPASGDLDVDLTS